MSRRVVFVAGVALGALSIWLTTTFVTASADISSPQTINVISKTVKFNFIDTGKQGPSPGDGIIGAANMFDKATGKRVGYQVFHCFAVGTPDPSGKTQTVAECTASARFSGAGEVTVAGQIPFPPNEPFVLAITGGTGRYRNVRGQFADTPKSATEDEQIFTLIP